MLHSSVDTISILTALRRAKTARRCASGSRLLADRNHHLGRARQWLHFARIINQSALRRLQK